MGYVVPFAEIILFMLDKSIVVDKVFILLIGVLLSILVFNSVFSIIRIIEKKSLESTNFILKNSLDSTDKNITLHENAKEIFNHQTNVNTTVRKMIEAHEKQIRNLQDQVVRLRRRSKD
jgi:biopolymer transport protein ExbB/TolQ